METTMIIVLLLFIVLAIGMAAYYFYFYLPGSTNAKRYEIPLVTSEIVMNEDYESTFKVANLVSSRPTLSVPGLGYGVSFAWEMYIPNLAGNDRWQNKFNIVKPIIAMNDSPQIGYNPQKNFLSIILKYRDNPFYAQYAEIRADDLKLQSWNKYILVINGRTVNLFINGTLKVSKYLPSVPVIYDINSDIVIGKTNNNFLGKIRNLMLYPFPLTYKETLII